MKFSPFVLLCTTGLFAIFSSTISKSPVLPLFASHLGADPSGVGFVAAVSAFTGIVASIPAGILSDRLGRRKMLVFSLIVFSTAPFLYLFVNKIWQLAIVRFYHGFATAVFIPVAMALVADLFHHERGEKMGWFSTSTLVGRFMAPIAGGSIMGAMVFNPGLGYKIVYLVCGAAGIIALILTFKLPSAPDKKIEKRDWKETFASFKSVLSNRLILITAGVEASILFAYGTFETFLPLYSIKIGLSAYEVGIFLSSQVITLALTKPVMGRFSDRHGRQPQIFWGAIIGALCIGGFALFKSFILLLALSILFGLSLSIVTSATSAFIADLSKKESHGSAMGLLGSIMDIGHTAGPLISGIVALHFGFDRAFLGAASVLIAAAFIFLIKVLRTKTALQRQ
ncbi:MFS transporter [Dissulfurispira sp.]|uniref:MFS transporter n=1 Tax=Dissulfurispira sp. TaxID=2817609 RepID=UPI002FD9B84A